MLGAVGKLFGLERPASLEDALLGVADEVWEVAERTRGEHYPFFEHPWANTPEERAALEADRERRVDESFRRLLARWPEPELTRLAADMYFDSRAWHDRYAWDHRRPEATRYLLPARGRIVAYLLHRWVAAHPPTDLAPRLRGRLRDLFRDPQAGPPVPAGREHPYPPTMRSCLDLLQGLESPEALALVHDFLRGALEERTEPDARAAAEGRAPASTYAVFSSDFNRAAPWMLRRAWHAELLDEKLIEEVFRRQTFVLAMATQAPGSKAGRGNFYDDLGPELGGLIRELTRSIVRRWAEKLDAGNARMVSEVTRLEGSWFLLQACRYVEELKLKTLPPNDYSHRGQVAAAVTRLCGVVRPGEDDEATIRALRSFKESTLLFVLPPAPEYQETICQALGWDGAYQLVQIVRRIARFDETSNWDERDVRSSPDPTNGVFSAWEVRELQDRLGQQRFAQLLKALASAPVANLKNALYLVEAAVGTNQPKVIESFAKRNQVAVRALGLLPLGDAGAGEIARTDEVLRRYVALRQFAKEAAKFGMQRQTNERAAALAGLANLALNAGYADATRLEWAMEDLLGAEIGAAGRTWQVDVYEVRLEVGADGPDLTAYKDGKPLKTLPAALKKHPDYEAMKEAKTELRSQARRYRVALEEAMCRGEELTPSELVVLARNPAARRMLAALLFVDGAGRFGLYDPDSGELLDLDGGKRSDGGPVRIAHPHDLYRAGLLAAWQRELVRRRVVQPFKQVFRELYVLTPAEEETRVFSRRFAGQVVGSAQAARLLQAEGWDCVGEDYPRKAFRREGLVAYLSFAESYHFMSEVESLVVDEVYFLPLGGPRWWGPLSDPRVALGEVPAVVFSEVMRDVDLVASVAQYTPDPAQEAIAAAGGPLPYMPTAEVIERRGDLVRELAADLGLKNVSVDGHFARIKGKLASYRLHLGSAAIHIEPGAYLCVVPARWGQKHEKLFLPFDAEDLKTSEVVSKVLLLAEDGKIKDESILSQIRSRTAR